MLVETDYFGCDFVDYFTVARINGRWWITNKTYAHTGGTPHRLARGARVAPYRHTMTEFVDQDLSGARFERVKLNGALMRRVDLRGAEIRGALFEGVRIRGRRARGRRDLRGGRQRPINGVDVAPLIEAELDRRDPDRAKMQPDDVVGSKRRGASSSGCGTTPSSGRVRCLRRHLHALNGEWSFIETLRHINFASAAWVGLDDPRRPLPVAPARSPWDEAPGWDGIPWDSDVRPTLDEVLAVRRERQAMVGGVIASLSAEQLASKVSRPRAGMATAGGLPLQGVPADRLGRGVGAPRLRRTRPCQGRRRIALSSDGGWNTPNPAAVVDRAHRSRAGISVVALGVVIDAHAWLTAEPREVGVQEDGASFREDAEEVTTVDGVYVYDTSGSESIDVLGGDSHAYPRGDGVDSHDRGLWRSHDLEAARRSPLRAGSCAPWTGAGSHLARTACTHSSARPTTPRSCATATRGGCPQRACRAGPARAATPIARRPERHQIVGIEPFEIDRETARDAFHAEWLDNLSRGSDGTVTTDVWIDTETGLMLGDSTSRLIRENDSVVGKVAFDEQLVLQLRSLVPRR